ncbi:hypothetical protein TWF106_009022 [Orbilia oligospora]|uniref:VOC domain-containing protein n=2 Tax=Orbilia oligospora TaxID=2813651 RepID=A0A7C8UMF7_ORBOL|nr:hypothetical protein TWF106_009022 [Orbilia oligospora]KAF3222315.1 hypothetical protein TWF679_005797 [Orbilia oligospora]
MENQNATSSTHSDTPGESIVAPNSGSTVPARVAMKSIEHVPATRWNSSSLIPKIKITKISHMRYQHPLSGINELTTFLLDFGMEVVKRTETAIWFGGYGIDHYVYYAGIGSEKEFLGGTWEVESWEDLERASKLGNSPIIELKQAPGGGHMTTVHDPEGFPVNFIYGASPRPQPKKKPLEALQINDEFSKPRKGAFQRFKPGPAAVHKLGHFGLTIHNFELQFKWYTSHFNLVPSDILYAESDPRQKFDVAAFLHIDRGKEYVDHHSFFLSVATTQHVHHSSFEVHDYDSQNMGHYWLKQKGHKPVWGLGRHRLGSQIFDYWWDPNGFMVEHYIDGDLVNEDTPTGRQPAGDESLAVWGEPVPATFLD